jgi:hypothetical protein
VTIASSGNLNPGSGGVGTLSVSNASATPGTGAGATALLSPGSNFNADLDFTAGTYDQLKLLGTVNLDGANLNLLATGTPTGSEVITLIDNDQADAVGGTFAGLAEGAEVTVAGVPFRITYLGTDGQGNDVVLTAVPEPAAIGGLAMIGMAALLRRRRKE